MLKQINFKNKRILVLGLGISGVSTFDYLKEREAKIIVIDDLSSDKLPVDVLDKVQYSEGQFFGGEIPPDEVIKIADLLVVSPGVYPSHLIYKKAEKFGIPIKNDINLFLDEWNNSAKVVGVTGSNGKSTIVSLTDYVLNCVGVPHKMGGNIGHSPLDWITEDKLTGEEIIILELSNYQLELFDENYFVDIAVITNISNNHLSRYGGSIEDYAKAKANIIKTDHTDLIVEGDNEGIQKYILPIIKTKSVCKVSLSQKIYDAKEDGIYTDNDGNLVLKKKKHSDIILFNKVSERKLFGKHNLYNIASVFAICDFLEIDLYGISNCIREFSGLPHRIQFVDEIDGVRYINDSKSTSPDATLKAVESLVRGKNIILVAGGLTKVANYREWKKMFEESIKGLILLPGDATEQIKYEAKDLEKVEVLNMKDAVMEAKNMSEEGDVVLLSPGAASQGLFRDFMDRGSQFMDEVRLLNTND